MRFGLTDEDAARFWSKVDRIEDTDSCWLWTARLFTQTGYGMFSVKQDDNKWRPTTAHRVSYQLSTGVIPDGLQIDHLCRVRACVRPSHLEAVTQRVNILRGTSPAALAALTTECPQGHAYSPDNTYVRRDGHRECRVCMRVRDMNRVRSDGNCAICGAHFTSHNRGVQTCSRDCTMKLVWKKRRAK